MTGVRTIVFDLGGVLVRICRTWEEACARAGIEARSMDRFRAPDLAAERRRLHGLHQVGQIACGEYFRAIASATAGLYSASEVERIHRAWTGDDYPGVLDAVAIARRAGVRTACLSNTNASHWETLTRGRPGQPASRAVGALDTLLASHLLAAAKPDDGIYALAERSLGAQGGEILFFDDLDENVAAAAVRGWRAHHIDHASDTAAQIRAAMADHGIS